MQNNNNLVAEIGLIILSALIVAGAVVLLVLGKTDYAETAGLVGTAVALWGGNLLYKAPSPSQQTTLVQALAQKPSQAQPPIVIHNNIPATPAPVPAVAIPAPAQPFAPNPTPAQLTAPPQQFVSPFSYAPSSTYPGEMPAVQP